MSWIRAAQDRGLSSRISNYISTSPSWRIERRDAIWFLLPASSFRSSVLFSGKCVGHVRLRVLLDE
tara:strand:+ start:257 stop:454 length:198 start_codon:yes stop_codon:yes gene_type:complete